jgi:hypothetical protein
MHLPELPLHPLLPASRLLRVGQALLPQPLHLGPQGLHDSPLLPHHVHTHVRRLGLRWRLIRQLEPEPLYLLLQSCGCCFGYSPSSISLLQSLRAGP